MDLPLSLQQTGHGSDWEPSQLELKQQDEITRLRAENERLKDIIKAAEKRIGNLKGLDYRHRQGESGMTDAEVITEMEIIAHSAICYLDGQPGPYLPEQNDHIDELEAKLEKLRPKLSPESVRTLEGIRDHGVNYSACGSEWTPSDMAREALAILDGEGE